MRRLAKNEQRLLILFGAAVFLASEASCFVNGHILYVDGGVTATL